MARNVFYSFHYSKDINRVMVVRNRWVTQGTQTISGVIDKAEFEEIKRKGDSAVYNWIDEQMKDTSVTVILIGEETLSRPFVQYEICKSINRGNGIIGVHINRIKDMITCTTSLQGNVNSCIGKYKDGSDIIFKYVADGLYDYVIEDGYNNLGKWVEMAAQRHNK